MMKKLLTTDLDSPKPTSRHPLSTIHDLYIVFKGRKGPKLFNFDWWQFKQ